MELYEVLDVIFTATAVLISGIALNKGLTNEKHYKALQVTLGEVQNSLVVGENNGQIQKDIGTAYQNSKVINNHGSKDKTLVHVGDFSVSGQRERYHFEIHSHNGSYDLYIIDNQGAMFYEKLGFKTLRQAEIEKDALSKKRNKIGITRI